MKYKNLILIGTSHISKESIEEVKNTISQEKPEIVALELDRPRLDSLLNKKERSLKLKDFKKIGFTGLLFNLMGAWAEKKLGSLVDTEPGAEMLTAFNIAKKENLKIALIDQDIRITLQKLSKEMKFKEKFRLLSDLLFGNLKKQKIKIDLDKVPDQETIKILTKEFKKRYPSLYKILVLERNKVMAKNLNRLINNNPNSIILAVIGAGHEEEILKIIQNAQRKNN